MKAITAAMSIAAVGLASYHASADVLVGWDVSTLPGGANNFGPTPLAPTVLNANVTSSGFVRGSGVSSSGTGAGHAWGGNNWQAADENSAVSASQFVTFTVVPVSGQTVSFTSISKFSYRRSGTGPSMGELQYQIGSGPFVDIAPLNYSSSASTGGSLSAIDLSGVNALQNVSSSAPVTFRIANWGGTSSAGTWYVFSIPSTDTGDDFEVQGTVNTVSTGTAPSVTGITPADVNTNAGGTASFTVASTGDTPNYYWYQQTGSTSNLVATTGPTVAFANLTGANAGTYFVVLSNAFGTAISGPVTIEVADPVILSQSGNVSALVNGTAQFNVLTAGSGLTYQWYQFDGAATYSPLTDGTLTSGAMVSGSTTSSLQYTNLQTTDATNLVLVVNGTYGAVTSSIVTLSVGYSGQLAFWDFNGTAFTNNPLNPLPYVGAGTASAVNTVVFSGAADPIDGPGFNTHLPNFSWGSETYPVNGTGNKTAGVQFNVSTVGAKNIMVSYDSRVSATASNFERLQYTTNGIDWVDYPSSSTFGGRATSFYPFTYDLTGFPGVANNPSFAVRIVSEFQSTASYGVTNNNNYVGAANTYGAGGTVTYDIVNVTGTAITNNNTPPTISLFPDTTTPDYQPVTLNFTIGDAETPVDSLTLSAVSLDPTAKVYPGFVFGGTGANRTLTINPNSINDSIEAAPILVTVTDGNGDSTATWFVLTLTSVNQSPTNSLKTLITTNTIANTPITIPFTVGDDRTPVSGLTYAVASANNTLVPSGNIVINGQGTANPSVTITPASKQVGVASLTVTVYDNDATEPRNTPASIALMIRPNTNIVAIDYFNYDSPGALDAISAGYWQHLSGVFGQLQTAGGVATVDTFDYTENIQVPLLGAPYAIDSGVVLYSSFIVNLQDPTKLPTGSGTYFALFNDGSGVTGPYEGRVMTTTNGAADGYYRLGINNFGANAASGQIFPQDLATGSNYVVVVALDLSNGHSTLWVNPTDQSSASVTDTTDSTTLYNIADFELRQSGGTGGAVSLSTLKVGLTFDSVFPSLFAQPAGTNVILNWSDPTLGIQSATNVAGPYTDISGATPPYTNNTSTNSALFYRFGQ
ncbi:MAG TPA: hypothetical protein VGO57_07905 [Verrucomicrobiae bacterium]